MIKKTHHFFNFLLVQERVCSLTDVDCLTNYRGTSLIKSFYIERKFFYFLQVVYPICGPLVTWSRIIIRWNILNASVCHRAMILCIPQTAKTFLWKTWRFIRKYCNYFNIWIEFIKFMEHYKILFFSGMGSMLKMYHLRLFTFEASLV